MRSTANRRFYGMLTRDEIFDKVLLSRYLSLLSSDCYNCISAKRPKTGEEAAEMVADYESREAFSRSYLADDSTEHSPQKHHYKRENNHFTTGNNLSKGSGGSQSSNSNGSSPTSFNDQSLEQNNQMVVEKDIKKGMLEVKERKPIVCFGCGEAGHIRPNCPNRMRSVREEGVENGILVDGFLAGIEAKGLRIDTGSSRTVVHPDFVPSEAYTGRKIILDTWRGGEFSKHRIARIAIQVGSVETVAEVAVDENVKYPALLGMDLGKKMTAEMMSLLLHELDNNPPIESEREQQAQTTPIVITRVENERLSLEEKAVGTVVAQAVSEPVNLSDIFDFDDEFFVQDSVVNQGSVSCTGQKVELDDQTSLSEPVKFCEIVGDQAFCFLKSSVKIASQEKGCDLAEAEEAGNFEDCSAELQQDSVVPLGEMGQCLGSTHREGFGVMQTTSGRMCWYSRWPRMFRQLRTRMDDLAGSAKVKMKDVCQIGCLVQQSAAQNFLHIKTTRESTPARVSFLLSLLCVVLLFTLFIFSDQVLSQSVPSDDSLGAVLSLKRKGEGLPVFYAGRLPISSTGSGGASRMFSHKDEERSSFPLSPSTKMKMKKGAALHLALRTDRGGGG